MAEACAQHQAVPNQVSFKGTIQLLNQFMSQILGVKAERRANTYRQLLSMIVSNKVGNRPGRVEPRAVKRRRKPFPALHNRKNERKKIIKKLRRLHQGVDACA